MIYFIRPKCGGGLIKIGTTVQLSQRLSALVKECGQELKVIAVLPGSFTEETSLRHHFAHLQSHGEWFEPGDDLLAFIASHGQPWDGQDERSDKSVKIDRTLARQAAIIAEDQGLSTSAYLSELLRPLIERDWPAALQNLDKPKTGSE